MSRPWNVVVGACLVLALLTIGPAAAWAQARPQLSIELMPASVSLPWADPDVSPVLVAPPMEMKYRVHWRGRGFWTLTVQAAGDLVSDQATIPIENLSWTATPSPPFVTGTMSKTTAQLMATADDDQIGFRYGYVTFQLKNSWSYPIGTYAQTIIYTLATP